MDASLLLTFALRQKKYRKARWTIIIHPPNDTWPKWHVHLERKKLGGEYSWNIDGSRHDEHRFPDDEKFIKAAKAIAAEALGIEARMLTLIAITPPTVAAITVQIDEGEQQGATILAIPKSETLSHIVIFGDQSGKVHLILMDAVGKP